MRRFFALTIFCLGAFFTKGQEYSKNDLLYDLDTYGRQIERRHAYPFNWITREDFYAAIDRLKKSSDSLNEDELMVGMMHINRLINDEHTNIDFHQNFLYPIHFYWFKEGITAVAAFQEDSAILGRQLVSINDVAIDTVTKRLRELTGVYTENGFKTAIVTMLRNPAILHGLKFTSSNNEAIFSFTKNNSDTIKIKMHPVDNFQGGFIRLRTEKQLLRQSSEKYYWYRFDEAKRYLYIQYNKCRDDPDFPFADFKKSVMQTIEKKKPEKVIIDLRANGGGYTTVFKPLIVALSYSPELKDKKIFTLIGRNTFSAAVISAYLLQTTAHSKTIGEETGGKLNQAGGVVFFNLKKTKSTVYYSSRIIYLDATQKGGIIPDVIINSTLEDYMRGNDPVFNYAVEK